MNGERITEGSSWIDPRGQVMKTPDDVAEMLRLRACGWGLKRIARQLGCSHHTVKDYVAAGGVKPFKSPERPKRLDGLEGWLRERFIRHRGNADVVRQDLLAEKGVAVSRRTLQRAVQPYRQALKAEAMFSLAADSFPQDDHCGWPNRSCLGAPFAAQLLPASSPESLPAMTPPLDDSLPALPAKYLQRDCVRRAICQLGRCCHW